MRWVALFLLVSACQRRSEWPALTPATHGAPRLADAVTVVAVPGGLRLELPDDTQTLGSVAELSEALTLEADRRLSSRPKPQKGDRRPELPLSLALGAQAPFSQAHQLLMAATDARFGRLFLAVAGPVGRLDVPVDLPAFCVPPAGDEFCSGPVVDLTGAGLWLYAVPHLIAAHGCTGDLLKLPPDPVRIGACPTAPALFDAAQVAATWKGATLSLERCEEVDVVLRVAPEVPLFRVVALQQAFWREGRGKVVVSLLRDGAAGPACP